MGLTVFCVQIRGQIACDSSEFKQQHGRLAVSLLLIDDRRLQLVAAPLERHPATFEVVQCKLVKVVALERAARLAFAPTRCGAHGDDLFGVGADHNAGASGGEDVLAGAAQ